MVPWIDYTLPRELIAQEPLPNRADARLMLVDRARRSIDHYHIRDLPRLLQPGDRVVLNDTQVIPAQLRGVRTSTGGRWQGLFLGLAGEGDWKLVCKTRGRLKPMESIALLDKDGRDHVKLCLLAQLPQGEWLARPDSTLPALELLEEIGRVPLPPYIRGGNMVDKDVRDYQTVFAQSPGAVAAPTAGLHFTLDSLKAMEHSGVVFTAVTLHVGRGTFQPIEAENVDEHPMHPEWAELSAAAASEMNDTRNCGERLIAVGTTVARVLETVALAAASRSVAKHADMPHETPQLCGWQGETDLFIRPPYRVRAFDGLLTNFHFPRTTLLLLVQAFAGSELVRAAYDEAIREEYRFYSYGDAMLIV